MKPQTKRTATRGADAAPPVDRFTAIAATLADVIEHPDTPPEVGSRMREAAAEEMHDIFRRVDCYAPATMRRLYPVLLTLKDERALLDVQ